MLPVWNVLDKTLHLLIIKNVLRTLQFSFQHILIAVLFTSILLKILKYKTILQYSYS